MQIGTAEAREKLKELLDRVQAGETIEIARRGKVLAVLSAPSGTTSERFSDAIDSWRATWDVASWTDEDVFGEVRDQSPGRDVVL